MLAALGNSHAHGNLGKTTIGSLAPLDFVANNVLSVSGQVLACTQCAGVPGEDAGILAGDPGLTIGDGLIARGVHGLQVGHHVVIFQALDPFQTFLQLLNGVVQGAVGNPGLAVLAFQVEGHHDHAVQRAGSQRIVVIAQLFLEGLGGVQQFLLGSGVVIQASLLEGCHVPVVNTAGHSDGHSLQGISHSAGIQSVRGELGQIQHIGVIVQVNEALALAGVLVQPVPVDLHHVGSVAGSQGSGLSFLPAVPRAVSALNGDVGVFFSECLAGSLVCSLAGIAAPPADGQGDGIGGVDGVSLGSSLGRGGSSFRRSGLGRSCGAVGSGAAAACQQASSHNAGHCKGDCLFHCFSPPKNVHITRGLTTDRFIQRYYNNKL